MIEELDQEYIINEETQIPFVPIFIASGGKGLCGHTMVHSLLIQYPNNKIPVIVIPEVQSAEKIEEAVQKVKKYKGILTHTMVNTKLRNILIAKCEEEGVKHIDFMGPLANFLENELGMESVNVPGLYRRTNARYFERVEAIEYTLNHDDGLDTEKLHSAEIILTGVSRTGKTPLSVYMSMFGWKVANIPIIYGIDPPKELFEVDPKRVFGLYINVKYLIAQRQKRLNQMKNFDNQKYIDEAEIQKELRYAQKIFDRGKFTKINVTNKPIETTANEIIGFVSDRFDHEDRRFQST